MKVVTNPGWELFSHVEKMTTSVLEEAMPHSCPTMTSAPNEPSTDHEDIFVPISVRALMSPRHKLRLIMRLRVQLWMAKSPNPRALRTTCEEITVWLPSQTQCSLGTASSRLVGQDARKLSHVNSVNRGSYAELKWTQGHEFLRIYSVHRYLPERKEKERHPHPIQAPVFS